MVEAVKCYGIKEAATQPDLELSRDALSPSPSDTASDLCGTSVYFSPLMAATSALYGTAGYFSCFIAGVTLWILRVILPYQVFFRSFSSTKS